jgi:hypothetical protein
MSLFRGPKKIDKSARVDNAHWETIGVAWNHLQNLNRLAVPGGWLVTVGAANVVAMSFVPDADHRWLSTSVDTTK